MFALLSAAGGGGENIPPPPTKRQECPFFAEGRCENGPKCPWLHRISIKCPDGTHPKGFHGGSIVEPDGDHRKGGINGSSECQGQSQSDRNHQPDRDAPTLQQQGKSELQLVQTGPEALACGRVKANVCFEWEKTGRCARGNNCWYRHDMQVSKTADPSTPTNRANLDPWCPQVQVVQTSIVDGPPKGIHESGMGDGEDDEEAKRRRELKGAPCFRFLRGTCLKEEKCWYKHDVDLSGGDKEAARRKARRELREEPCFRYLQGTCFRGGKCWYSHDPEVAMKTQRNISGEPGYYSATGEDREKARKETRVLDQELARVQREVEDLVRYN